ncbi:glutamate--tRNA ligase [Candidatus Profftella armatura]|uniref:glutamate--tRNA ligase n=1 Tax=Candidatus Profftella armatura TaxID=669502 RepID=UPI003D95F9CA
MTIVRTRFAPSPTGNLHIGGIRTALFSWAYARHFNGIFILRIEDTDINRSTLSATQTIIDGMKWLGLNYDEGPFYQTKRINRYFEIINYLLPNDYAYYCYSSVEEIESFRKKQRSFGEKPRYNRIWRPEPGKILPSIPINRKPVIRFKNPLYGNITWNDLIKGKITISNKELDDLVIVRADGIPTYNFCAAIDDWDMKITHVIRGDDHINNTPRQINILKALGVTLPFYGHLPMVIDSNKVKISKRKEATDIMYYKKKGFLPEAILNYLARLGWSHGNEEIFSIKQFCYWFNDCKYLSKSPAQFNLKKLEWLNNFYIKSYDDKKLLNLIQPIIKKKNIEYNTLNVLKIISLFKNRVNTLTELSDIIIIFYSAPKLHIELLKKYITDIIKLALMECVLQFSNIIWEKQILNITLKKILEKFKLNMPQLAMPLRIILLNKLQTPSIDLILSLFNRNIVLDRIKNAIKNLNNTNKNLHI